MGISKYMRAQSPTRTSGGRAHIIIHERCVRAREAEWAARSKSCKNRVTAARLRLHVPVQSAPENPRKFFEKEFILGYDLRRRRDARVCVCEKCAVNYKRGRREWLNV